MTHDPTDTHTPLGARAARPIGRVALCLAVALAALAARPAPATAATFVADQLYDAALDPSAPPCVCRLSPRNPTCTLRAAIQAANACAGHDVIELGAVGVYRVQIAGSGEDAGLTGDLDVHEGITLLGNGQRIEALVFDRVLDVNVPPSQNVDLLEVTITRGRLPSVGSLANSGGGVRAQNATLTLDNVIVRQCQAANGAGLYAAGGPVTIVDSTFEDNDASNVGGGVALDDSDPAVLQGVILTQNTANAGGGMWADVDSSLSVDGAAFDGNEVTTVGGGAFIQATTNGLGQADLFGVVFSGNQANYGGGLAALTDGVPSELVVRGSLFTGNVAIGDGGGFAGAGTIERSTFVANRAAAGGALGSRTGSPPYSYGELHLRNCTLYRNVATGTGGAIISDSTVVASHLTLHANWAPYAGASIWSNGHMTLRSSILSSTASAPACDVPVSVGHNVTTDASCGATATDQVGVATGLAGYGDWGGPTPTFRLQPWSPAIDTADPSACPAVDQRGLPRPSGAGCDAGAYEHQVR